MRLIVDAHLGRLARWLRILGYDTIWDAAGSEARIVEASADGRLFITRHRAWLDKTLPGPRLVISTSRPLEQLAEVARACSLAVDAGSLFSRCSICNATTSEVTKSDVMERLPPYVARTRDRFRVCRECDRIYWRGSHVDAMLQQLKQAGLWQ